MQQIANLDWAGDDAFDVFIGNRFIGAITRANAHGKVRAFFNHTATAGSKRQFSDGQAAIAYLIARREKRIAKKAAAK